MEKTNVDLHLLIEPVPEHEVVCHAYPVWFHRVSVSIKELPNAGCVCESRSEARRRVCVGMCEEN